MPADGQTGDSPRIESTVIEEQLERVLSSRIFANSERLRQFLEYVVRQHLNGDEGRLKEASVGIDVFRKRPDYDPRLDSIVRSAASRLRVKLAAYYDTEGRSDTILISLPEGHYVPEFKRAVGPDSCEGPALDRNTGPAAGSGAAAPELSDAADGATADRERTPATTVSLPGTAHRRFRWRALLVLLSLVGLVILLVRVRPAPPVPRPLPAVGRILVRATSEGRSLTRISLSHHPEYLAISPDGKELYAANTGGRTLSVIDMTSNSVKEVPLPRGGGPVATSRDGRVFIASFVDGVMVWEPRTGLPPRAIPTGGPVFDVASTPDGSKLFLAMGTLGLKRLSTRTSELSRLSDRICPMWVTVNDSGTLLFVSYQCSEKEGRDDVEVFDTERGVALSRFGGPGVALAGGPSFISPDGSLLLADGWDACSNPKYSHEGCPVVPSHIAQLFQVSDGRNLRSFPFAMGTGSGPFIDASRFLSTGYQLRVVDARKFTVLERLTLDSEEYGSAAFSADRRRIYLGHRVENQILVLEADGAGCVEPEGKAMMFTGDGTWDDAVGLAKVEPRGDVTFRPGKVGQAFHLAGGAFLVAPWTGHYEFGRQDGAISLYVKQAELRGERTLLYRMTDGEKAGMKLLKAADDHIVCQIALGNGGVATIRSAREATADTWHHIVVTRTERELALYLDGVLVGSAALAADPAPAYFGTPLHIGAGPSGRSAVEGLLDEITFYRRGLTAGEVRSLYEMREAGPCKP